MSDDSGPEKTSAPAGNASLAGWRCRCPDILSVVVIWLAHKQSFFSAAWQESKASLHHLPEWSRLAVFGLIVLIIILWKVPQWQVKHVHGLEPKERWNLVNEARKTLATILGGGAVVLAGRFGTWQNL